MSIVLEIVLWSISFTPCFSTCFCAFACVRVCFFCSRFPSFLHDDYFLLSTLQSNTAQFILMVFQKHFIWWAWTIITYVECYRRIFAYENTIQSIECLLKKWRRGKKNRRSIDKTFYLLYCFVCVFLP